MTSIRNSIISFCVISAAILSILSSARAAEVNKCDIQSGACSAETTDGVQVVFDIQPKPVKPMSDLSLFVDLRRSNAPVADASVAVDFSMPGMFMGRNAPALKHVSSGQYRGKAVIPKCMKGDKTWQADVLITRKAGNEVVSFAFEVQ